jgi:hypothetical protein
MTRALRALALLIAVTGVIDPAIAVSRRQPVRVDFFGSSSASAIAVRDQLIRDLGPDIAADTGEAPAAVVIVADPDDALTLPKGVPVSVVTHVSANARNIRLVNAAPPGAVLVGQEAIVSAEFEAVGLKGEASTIELDQDGVRLAATEHRWTLDRERFTARLGYVPPAAGIVKVTVSARSAKGEASGEDNAVDLPLLVRARTLHVAVYEPRPSWAAGFVRRAIESDPLFTTSSLVRPSRGPVVTAGPRLTRLSTDALASYDAVLLGAPEDLTESEVAALSSFCELRGGAVIFLPDRRPSGSYARLVSSSGFDEALLDKPAPLVGDGPIGVSASEFALPRTLGPGATAVASLSQQVARAAIVSVPLGRGRILFSGALDAWRFRATGPDEAAFARFWTGIIADLAAASPRRLSISVHPALAAPGDRMRFRVAVDSLVFPAQRDGEGPPVRASLVARDGTEHFVRLWPAADPGAFEGDVVAPHAGSYDARASAAGSTADTPVIVADGVRHPPPFDDEALKMITETSGGVVVDATDTAPLRRHLNGLNRHDERRTLHPMRSGWWSLPFAAALCAEWTLRRRRGAR